MEVYFRTQLAYELARETGPFGFLDASNLPRLNRDEYDKFIARCKDELRRSRELLASILKRPIAMNTSFLLTGYSST